MRACSVSEQDSHIPLDRRTFLQWLSRWWRGQHESGSPSFSISIATNGTGSIRQFVSKATGLKLPSGLLAISPLGGVAYRLIDLHSSSEGCTVNSVVRCRWPARPHKTPSRADAIRRHVPAFGAPRAPCSRQWPGIDDDVVRS